MTQPHRDDLTDKAHLYRGLSEPPSAHSDPPASVVGPTGLREHPDSAKASGVDRAGAVSQQGARAARTAREELSYDTVRPRIRGGGAKALLGAGALLGAVVAFLILKFGMGPGSGGILRGDGGAPNPPTIAQATQPATAPATAPTISNVPAPAPAAPLQLTIVNETYHVGTADGKEVSLDEAVSMARRTRPSPVTINLIDSSRQGVKEDLRSALDRQQIPIIWTRDGKPVSGEVTGTGKAATPDDGGNK